MESLTAEIGRIAQQTTYGGAKILDGKAATGTLYTEGTDKAGSITFQVGANAGDTIKLDVANMRFSLILADASYKSIVNAGQADKGKVAYQNNGDPVKFALSQASSDAIGKLIKSMDLMIGAVDAQRAGLGAMQNRLESSIRNQSNTSANEADARSRIRDADFAEESANLSQQSIIQQAATSMLMQANTRPQLGLSLLR